MISVLIVVLSCCVNLQAYWNRSLVFFLFVPCFPLWLSVLLVEQICNCLCLALEFMDQNQGCVSSSELQPHGDAGDITDLVTESAGIRSATSYKL